MPIQPDTLNTIPSYDAAHSGEPDFFGLPDTHAAHRGDKPTIADTHFDLSADETICHEPRLGAIAGNGTSDAQSWGVTAERTDRPWEQRVEPASDDGDDPQDSAEATAQEAMPEEGQAPRWDSYYDPKAVASTELVPVSDGEIVEAPRELQVDLLNPEEMRRVVMRLGLGGIEAAALLPALQEAVSARAGVEKRLSREIEKGDMRFWIVWQRKIEAADAQVQRLKSEIANLLEQAEELR